MVVRTSRERSDRAATKRSTRTPQALSPMAGGLVEVRVEEERGQYKHAHTSVCNDVMFAT